MIARSLRKTRYTANQRFPLRQQLYIYFGKIVSGNLVSAFGSHDSSARPSPAGLPVSRTTRVHRVLLSASPFRGRIDPPSSLSSRGEGLPRRLFAQPDQETRFFSRAFRATSSRMYAAVGRIITWNRQPYDRALDLVSIICCPACRTT